MLSRIEQKLTYEAKLEWARHLDRNDMDNPTLLYLQEWLSSEKRTQIRIGAAIRSVGSGRINQMSGIKENTNWVNRSSYTENKSTNVKCWMCQTDSHWPDQCSNFNSLTPENRWEKLKKEQACFSCLKKAGRNHNIATCKRRRPCNAEMSNGKKCQQYHHRLLHYSNYNADYRASPTSSQSSTNQYYLQNSAESVPIPVDNSRRNGQSSNLPGISSGARPKTNNVSLAMVAESPSPLLPVAQVDFIGMNSKEQDSLLFDTGAQLSIIRDDLAAKLKLKGREVVVTISKVGEPEEQLITKSYLVPIKSRADGKVYKIRAIGMPSISYDTGNPDLDQASQNFGINRHLLQRPKGPIGLLLGTDYAGLHDGETKVKGNLVARKSPFGWIFFGSPGNTKRYNVHFFHIRLSKPVDLTAFWSSEAIVVVVKPCTCEADKMTSVNRKEAEIIRNLAVKDGNRWKMSYPWKIDPANLPDNRSQAVAKLESLERRLKSNLKMSDLYRSKMKEMTDMGFAKKLTPEEKNEYL
ncbi:Uncharacterised protein r2_g4128 [Pycnogonum litorale]